MISRLKYQVNHTYSPYFKCTVTLLSLIEGRKDNKILSRIVKSLQMDIL